DAYTGVNLPSLSITADFSIAGRPAGAELADLAQSSGDGIHVIALAQPITTIVSAHIHVSIRDLQGNTTRINRRFSVFLPPICASGDLNCDGSINSGDV